MSLFFKIFETWSPKETPWSQQNLWPPVRGRNQPPFFYSASLDLQYVRTYWRSCLKQTKVKKKNKKALSSGNSLASTELVASSPWSRPASFFLLSLMWFSFFPCAFSTCSCIYVYSSMKVCESTILSLGLGERGGRHTVQWLKIVKIRPK